MGFLDFLSPVTSLLGVIKSISGGDDAPSYPNAPDPSTYTTPLQKELTPILSALAKKLAAENTNYDLNALRNKAFWQKQQGIKGTPTLYDIITKSMTTPVPGAETTTTTPPTSTTGTATTDLAQSEENLRANGTLPQNWAFMSQAAKDAYLKNPTSVTTTNPRPQWTS